MSVSASGGNITVTTTGGTETRAASTVSQITITGASSLVVDASGGAIATPISFDGAAGSSLEVKGDNAAWSVSGSSGSVSGPATLTFTNVSSIKATGAGAGLTGPATDATWAISGTGAGTLGGLSFSGFTTLTGAPNTKDTFVVNAGSLPARIDGGAGGFDTLVVNGASGHIVASASSASSGSITVNTQTVSYAGLEPIAIGGTATDVVIDGTGGDDAITLKPGTPGNLIVEAPTMESTSFPIPTGSLTLSGAGGNDTITLTGVLALPGVTLVIRAEHIVVNGTVNTTGGATNGAVTLEAAHVDNGSTIVAVVTASGSADVSVTGATINSGSVNITASSTVGPANPGTFAAVLNASSNAAVTVTNSSITAVTDATLSARSSVDSTMSANGIASHIDSSADAAVAVSNVDSNATTQVSGASVFNVGGMLLLLAQNLVGVRTLGDASPATSGAGIAVSNVTVGTHSYIEGSSSVTANGLKLAADTDSSASAYATASPDGATANDSSPSARTGGNASTSDGTLNVAGALSFSRLVTVTDAYIAGSGGGRPSVTTSGEKKVHAASSAKSASHADGSVVGHTGSGVGVAIAVNLATITTSARLGDADLSGGAANVEALAPGGAFEASSISGAGDSSKVTFAGSLAVGVITMNTTTGVDAGKTVGATGTDLSFTATGGLDSTASATPALAPADDTPGATGIGASVAIHIVTQKATATVGDGATVSADDLSLDATNSHGVVTIARGGAEGGTAVSAVVAVTFSTLETTAAVGNTVALTLTGNFKAHATDLSGAVSTSASGDADGSGAAVGASVALNVA